MQAPGIRWTGGWGQGFWQSQASAWAGTCGCSSPSHISEEASAAVREAVSCGEGMGTDSASFSRIRAAVLIGAACTATRPTCKQSTEGMSHSLQSPHTVTGPTDTQQTQ